MTVLVISNQGGNKWHSYFECSLIGNFLKNIVKKDTRLKDVSWILEIQLRSLMKQYKRRF